MSQNNALYPEDPYYWYGYDDKDLKEKFGLIRIRYPLIITMPEWKFLDIREEYEAVFGDKKEEK